LLSLSDIRRVFDGKGGIPAGAPSSTRHTVAVDWTQATDPELVRLLEEQAALRRVATLVARGTDRLGVFAAVAEEVGRLFGADVPA
jgi:hypothetical protein